MLSTPRHTFTFLLCTLITFSTTIFAQTNKACSNTLEYCEGHKVFENGNTYDGEMAYGIPSGNGLMKFSNGDEYLGDFDNGKMHGKGAILLVSGDSYHGDWNGGEADGKGTYKKNDGSSFKGNFRKGMRDGEGTVIWKAGDTLRGNWNNDKLDGKAIFEFANGDRLETNWKNGSMRVNSKYVKENGKMIQGSMNTIFMVIDMEDDFAETKEVAMGNLQLAWISSAMEFQASQEYDLAIDFLMAAQKYGPSESDQQTVIAQQLKAIDSQKNNSGWAQLPRK